MASVSTSDPRSATSAASGEKPSTVSSQPSRGRAPSGPKSPVRRKSIDVYAEEEDYSEEPAVAPPPVQAKPRATPLAGSKESIYQKALGLLPRARS